MDATDEMPKLPDDILSTVRPSRFWTLESEDFASEADVSELVARMYDYPEDSFYLYCLKDGPIPDALRGAIDSRIVLIKEWQHNHYPHPRFKRDYVRLFEHRLLWDWERELFASSPTYIRYELALSAQARLKLEQQQFIAMHKSAESNPIELKPNFMGLGIDVYKAIDWLRSALRGTHK